MAENLPDGRVAFSAPSPCGLPLFLAKYSAARQSPDISVLQNGSVEKPSGISPAAGAMPAPTVAAVLYPLRGLPSRAVYEPSLLPPCIFVEPSGALHNSDFHYAPPYKDMPSGKYVLPYARGFPKVSEKPSGRSLQLCSPPAAWRRRTHATL